MLKAIKHLAKVTITRQAKADLKRIWRFIALDNNAAATKFLLKIDQRIAQLKDFPEAGNLRPEIRDNCRMLVVTEYRILYEFDAGQNALEIVAVVEPYRDVENLF
jgi:toxin ParE1/3/4